MRLKNPFNLLKKIGVQESFMYEVLLLLEINGILESLENNFKGNLHVDTQKWIHKYAISQISIDVAS